MSSTPSQIIQNTYRQPYESAAARRESHKQSAEKVNITDAYENFIWELARKFTGSNDEAEAAAQEMFADIRRCGEPSADPPPIEAQLDAHIALRRLLMFLE